MLSSSNARTQFWGLAGFTKDKGLGHLIKNQVYPSRTSARRAICMSDTFWHFLCPEALRFQRLGFAFTV